MSSAQSYLYMNKTRGALFRVVCSHRIEMVFLSSSLCTCTSVELSTFVIRGDISALSEIHSFTSSETLMMHLKDVDFLLRYILAILHTLFWLFIFMLLEPMVFEDLFMGMTKMVPLYTVKHTALNYDGDTGRKHTQH